MGSLILCHNRQAQHPYEISRIHKKIYTIEELCYYLTNHLYLIDHTLMNQQLCTWLDQELGLGALSKTLKFQLSKNATALQFVLTILESSDLYSAAELARIETTLERLKNQKEVEREKYKADALLDSGEYAAAILVYQTVLNKDWDETIPKAFYGRTYASLGSCYGRLFLYEEAARRYKEALTLVDDHDILKAYLYSCYKAYEPADYVKLLSNNAQYLNLDREIKAELEGLKKQVNIDVTPERLKKLKQDYRKIDK